IREIQKRLIVDCTFVNRKTTVKALIDPKSEYNSISKALARKMDLYITRMDGSKYPAVETLGIGATNAGKKVMVRGWLRDNNISVSLPNIFESGKLKSLPQYLNETYTHFVVIDKPEYDLVLGNVWLMHTGYRIDKYKNPPLYINIPKGIEKRELEKSQYHARNSIWKLSHSLYTFYELLFPEFITTDSDGEVILIKFSDQNTENTLIDLNEYYDSEYSETESESSDSETESEFSDSEVDVPLPVIIGTIQDNNRASVEIHNIDFISAFDDY